MNPTPGMSELSRTRQLAKWRRNPQGPPTSRQVVALVTSVLPDCNVSRVERVPAPDDIEFRVSVANHAHPVFLRLYVTAAGACEKEVALTRRFEGERPGPKVSVAPVLHADGFHADLGADHILLVRQARKWSVSAVLDWGLAMSGPLLLDIGSILRYSTEDFERAFEHGCLEGGGELEHHWRRNARVLDMMGLCWALPRASEALSTHITRLLMETVEALHSPSG